MQAPEILIDPLDPSSEVHGDVSSKDMPTDKASQDVLRPTEVADEEGSSKGRKTDEWGRPMTLYGDLLRVWGIKKTPVEPTVVVIEKYRRLFEATLKGNWKDAKKILDKDHEAIKAEVMTVASHRFTVLQVAIMAAQDQLVENLIKHFPQEKNILIRSLTDAARGGRIRMVKALVDEIDRLDTSGTTDFTQLLDTATIYAPMRKEVICCLARRKTSIRGHGVLISLVYAGHLDIALCLARQNPSSVIDMHDVYENILGSLATMKFCFLSGAGLNFWEKCIYKCIPLCLVQTFDISQDKKTGPVAVALNWLKKSLWNLATKSVPFIKRIGESKGLHNCSLEFARLVLKENMNLMGTTKVLEFLLTSGVVLDAASRGNSEIVNLCLEHFPELMWEKDFTIELIKAVVNGRHVEVFRVVNTHSKSAKLIDDPTRNFVLMKEFVQTPPGRAPADDSGAAFLLQREIQWYKVLEDSMEPSQKCMRVVDHDKTYWEAFVANEEGGKLVKEAGQWIKDTSSSCSVVATLIITVAFAAAFTVPGGNEGSTGIPIFLKRGSFIVFAVADALALFFSVTATLMFLAILSSRYTFEDFLKSLPRKMLLGLTFLFLSLALMLVAFSSALSIVLSERFKWIYIPITLFASLPVVLFATVHFTLYAEMVESTYWPRLYRPVKLWK